MKGFIVVYLIFKLFASYYESLVIIGHSKAKTDNITK